MDTVICILMVLAATGLIWSGLLLTWHTRLPTERIYQGTVERIIQSSPAYLEVQWMEPTATGDILCHAHTGAVTLPDRHAWRLLLESETSLNADVFAPGRPVLLLVPHHWRPGWNVQVLGMGGLKDVKRQQQNRGVCLLLLSLPALWGIGWLS